MQAVSSYHSDRVFAFNVTVTLTFELMTSKYLQVIYRSSSASMSSLRVMGAGNVELSLGQAFCVQLDLDLKINMGHLLFTTSLHFKFEGNYAHLSAML